jgi:phospholipid transport system substrate-binding protein
MPSIAIAALILRYHWPGSGPDLPEAAMHTLTHRRPRLFNWSLIVGIALWLLPIAPSRADMAETPTEAVRTTIEDVVLILSNEELKRPDHQAERRQEIEGVLRQRVSYEDMAKQALGAQWLGLEVEERREFVDLFVQLLRDSFAGKIDAYADEQVLYLSEQQYEGVAEVRTKLSGRKSDTLLDFRLADHNGTWLVYDVVIDGASIVHNYRAQFASIIRHVSYPGLVKRMRDRALVVKTSEPVVSQ